MMLRKIIFSIWCLFLFIGSGYSQNTASLPYWTQILPKSSISSNDSCAVFDHATLKWKKVNCYELGDGRFVKTTGDTVTGNLIFSDANEGIVFTSGGFLKSDGSGSTLSDGFNNYIELDGDVYIADQTGCNIDLSSSGVSIYDAANSNSIQLSNAGVGIFNNFSSGLHLYTTDNNLNGFGNQLIQQSTGTTISGPNIALTTAGDYTFDGGSITASRVPYIDASKNLKTPNERPT